MTDRKLLEDAARAAGYVLGAWDEAVNAYIWLTDKSQKWWNPAEPYTHGDCMGDSLRLAVKLGIEIGFKRSGRGVWVSQPWKDVQVMEDAGGEVTTEQITRRAIVRVAATIGKTGEPT